MKVIQVMPEFGLAGAEIMAENLMYELIKNYNIDVIAVSFYRFKSPITERLEKNNIRIIYLDKKPGLDLSINMKLRAIFKDEKPDVVHTHRYVLPYVFVASMGLNIKIVHTVHNIAEKEVPEKQQILQKYIFRQRKVVPVAISPLVKVSILDRYNLNEKSVPMIYNGVDVSKYSKKRDYSLANKGVILHVGRFSEQKNHILLIKAFSEVLKKVPDCQLRLIGDGELLDGIKELSEKNGIRKNVNFLGLRDDIPKQMNQADIFVLPSNYEGMPITLIEAMATGLPIIATRVGGVPDMINSENGVLINNSIEELVGAIVEFLQSEQMRFKLGTKAYQDSEKFSSCTMAKEYYKLYSR